MNPADDVASVFRALPGFEVIAFDGPDAATFLQAQLASDVASLAVGATMVNLAKRSLHLFDALADDLDFFVDTTVGFFPQRDGLIGGCFGHGLRARVLFAPEFAAHYFQTAVQIGDTVGEVSGLVAENEVPQNFQFPRIVPASHWQRSGFHIRRRLFGHPNLLILRQALIL